MGCWMAQDMTLLGMNMFYSTCQYTSNHECVGVPVEAKDCMNHEGGLLVKNYENNLIWCKHVI